MINRSVFLVALILCYAFSSATRCDRKPAELQDPKSSNLPPYKIVFKGDGDYYIPNTTYTVLLQGNKPSPNVTHSFKHFILTVEAEDYQNYNEDENDFVAGKFQLTGDVKTKVSEECPNTVTHASSIQKSEIQVFWTAPKVGSGCVVFRATIVENRDIWYMDDGQLSKKICEESNESDDKNAEVVYECCACDEAKFELTFEGLWSRHTHPKDYPDDNWQTRFSDVIGASHTIDYRFWEQNQVSSAGMNAIANNGVTSTLESELKSKSDKIRTIIKARGISYPNVTGKTFAVFRVDREHHLISVVSFMFPSPDWFVGISGLELCLPNCNWITNKTINLYPWDAGIKSGVTYNSSDIPQVPISKIERVLKLIGKDKNSPFYEENGENVPMKPIAKLHLMRQRLYEKSCSEEEPKSDSTICDTGSWSDWNECSVTCGKGYSNRNRQYINPDDFHKPVCKQTQLNDRKGCYVVPSCSVEMEETMIIDPRCDVTAFGPWSDCSSTCGPGVRARFRTLLNEDVAPKYCLPGVYLQQTTQCESETCKDELDTLDFDALCSNCSLTRWSLWSPCNRKCGEGQRERSRSDLHSVDSGKLCDKRCYTQTINCKNNPTCESNTTIEPTTITSTNLPETKNTTEVYVTVTTEEISEDSTDKCILTKWSKYSNCSNVCGEGYKERTRSFLSPLDPLEQKKCKKKLVNRRYCKGKLCNPCNYSPWTDWSLCSAPCGMNAVQQRTRVPQNITWSWCNSRLEQRICSALACRTK